MANKNVAIGCMLLGLIALIASGIAGIAFQSSREFVVATLTCNPEAEDTIATDEFCVDNVVVDADGEVCQIGSLGLFAADFTPECSYDSNYTINPLLTPQDGVDPTEFGVLFPAQNQLGGLGVPEALNVTEFDNCEDYFALDGRFSQALQGAAASGVDEVIAELAESLKTTYDEGLDSNFADADAVFEALPLLLLSLLPDVGGPAVTDVFDGIGGTYDMALTAAIGALNFFGSPLEDVAILAQGIIQLTFANTAGTCGTGAASPLGLQCLAFGLTVGAPAYNDPVPSTVGFVGGVAADGYFSPLDGSICNVVSPGLDECTFFDFFSALVPFATSVERFEPVPSLVGLLSLFLTVAETQLPPGVDTALALENIRNGTALGVGLVDTLYGKDAMITVLKSLLNEEGAVPETLFGPAVTEQTGFAIVCGSSGLAQTCSFDEIIDAQLNSTNATAEPGLVAQLALGDALLAACDALSITTLSACVSQVAIFSDFPGRGVPIDEAVDGVLGGLYGIENVSLAEALEAAVDACEDDELDAAAIVQAQMLVPPGVALVLVGAAIGVVALVVFALANKKVAKGVVVLGGILSLVGAILVLVGLLGVQQAPIFESVGGGGDGEIEDNGRLFSTGQGSLLALVTIGAGIVGGIVMTIGGCLLPTEDSDDVLAAKA